MTRVSGQWGGRRRLTVLQGGASEGADCLRRPSRSWRICDNGQKKAWRFNACVRAATRDLGRGGEGARERAVRAKKLIDRNGNALPIFLLINSISTGMGHGWRWGFAADGRCDYNGVSMGDTLVSPLGRAADCAWMKRLRQRELRRVAGRSILFFFFSNRG